MEYIQDVRVLKDGELATAIVGLSERMEVLSSAVINGGHTLADTLFISQLAQDNWIDDPLPYIQGVMRQHGIPDSAVGFLTTAKVEDAFSAIETQHEGATTFAGVTAGLGNHVVAGELLVGWGQEPERVPEKSRPQIGGTINIIGVSPLPLMDEAKVNIFIAMTEAKSAALRELGHKETGTTSDAIAIVSPVGDSREQYAGTGTPLGISMARSVKAAVEQSLESGKTVTHG